MKIICTKCKKELKDYGTYIRCLTKECNPSRSIIATYEGLTKAYLGKEIEFKKEPIWKEYLKIIKVKSVAICLKIKSIVKK